MRGSNRTATDGNEVAHDAATGPIGVWFRRIFWGSFFVAWCIAGYQGIEFVNKHVNTFVEWIIPAAHSEPRFHTQLPHAGHSEDLMMHDKFYKKWNRPDMIKEGRRYSSCCNKKDCYATTIKPFDDGFFYAQRREDRRWIQIPTRILEENQEDGVESPDGNSHVCMSKPLYGYGAEWWGEGDMPPPPEPKDAEPNEKGYDSTVFCAVRGMGL